MRPRMWLCGMLLGLPLLAGAQKLSLAVLDAQWKGNPPRYLDHRYYFIPDTLATDPVQELWQYEYLGKGPVTLTKYIYKSYPGHAPLQEMDMYVRSVPSHEEDVIQLHYDVVRDTLTARYLHRINPEYQRQQAELLVEENTLSNGEYGLCGTETYRRLHEGHAPEVDRPVSLEEAADLLRSWGWR